MSVNVRRLLDTCGTTYAEQAGITLANKPGPLYQLLVLTVLLSTRVHAELAISAARELTRSGLGTPQRMLEAGWQQRVDALGRAHYVRYDESTATALGDGAEMVINIYKGDLRRMRPTGARPDQQLRSALDRFPRIGPVGADIFCREVQAIWPELRPFLDRRALEGARLLDLPENPRQLARMVPDGELARLAAALVRVSLHRKVVQQLRS